MAQQADKIAVCTNHILTCTGFLSVHATLIAVIIINFLTPSHKKNFPYNYYRKLTASASSSSTLVF